MRVNQDERRFDFHGLGAALKRAREEKGWTQAYVAELVDRDINVNIKMYIFDHLRMYIFAILPLDRYIFLSDKIFL